MISSATKSIASIMTVAGLFMLVGGCAAMQDVSTSTDIMLAKAFPALPNLSTISAFAEASMITPPLENETQYFFNMALASDASYIVYNHTYVATELALYESTKSLEPYSDFDGKKTLTCDSTGDWAPSLLTKEALIQLVFDFETRPSGFNTSLGMYTFPGVLIGTPADEIT